MKVSQIQLKAKVLGLDPGHMKKFELIRNIQAREGNEACFKSMRDYCDQYDCCWREDCLSK